ncbi:hypothetical protein EJ05DRAFT_479553 [Pseudovirgaria hyperparasitica]|uniref:N-methyltransferase n=1 Tax=Pseudovirgaria hyperparasitica TaxID=470096 RepID=A0A6A6VWN8_9PEZI|nr:uncharacterized protein EJ05DRAFT_479553 [Pseudovirgaria hyperparasitica]KAF2754585.1 hypothetical protein EJ05DRAFT_479553 [Pseudovirgaria hyperparasitica]
MAIQTLSTFTGPVSDHQLSRDAHRAPPVLNIIDIRRDADEFDILDCIHTGLRPADGGKKTMPTLLLYDEEGLKLFEKITYLDEYYLTNAEIEVLSLYADRIAQRIQPHSIILELGSGNLRKVNILLQALERAGKEVEYFALDLNLAELERTLSDIRPGTYKHVRCSALHGTYNDGLEWLKRPSMSSKPKTVLSLGSSLGNFKRSEAASFLDDFCQVLQPGDNMLIGIDACKDAPKVYRAYNDDSNVTHQFTLNGLKHANQLLGSKGSFNLDEWEAVGVYEEAYGRHAAFVAPTKDVIVDGVAVIKGERIRIEESHKYSASETEKLWQGTGFLESAQWRNGAGFYGLHLVSKPRVFFPMDPETYAARPVPTLREWDELWKMWDLVTREMIPGTELLSKPIELRNVCLFYLGHIPTFLDIHLTRATADRPTEPAYYQKIFERGIDPDVDNPEKCHAHSEIPDEWPPAEEVIEYQARVRSRVRQLYQTGQSENDSLVRRALWFGYEHEIMHLETLLYMLIQSNKTRPPPVTPAPDFEALAAQAQAAAVPNQWFKVPEATITLGLDDAHRTGDPSRYYGWDVEVPSRRTNVKAFEAKARPITNGEYADYLTATQSGKIPASWATDGDPLAKGTIDRYVRTVYGNVPLKYVLDWPVSASYDEVAACAQWMGGRIPSEEEVRSIYAYVDHKTREANKNLANTIPAVNGHLSNNGVQETPPSETNSNGFSDGVHRTDPKELFVTLSGANVGFKHWHPTAVAANGDRLSGQGDFGGLWEWTSTVLMGHEGYEPMDIYPGYSADFFDGKHNIVLGGSWATHPRLAGRKSFVNWYQRNYPYAWAGARVVRDL